MTAGAAESFERVFGARPPGLQCARAPGRVNLLGEHTDYNGGFVLPIAVDRAVRVCFRAAAGPVRLWSEDAGSWAAFELADLRPPPPGGGAPPGDGAPDWGAYARGVAWALQEAGHRLRAIQGVVSGDVPMGSGLSSSAALEVAVGTAFCAAAGLQIDGRALALACQRAEHAFTGVRCGVMDQFASIHGRSGCALLLDCRSLDFEEVPLDAAAVRVVVCNTGVRHALGQSAYNERRASCERAVERLSRRLQGVRELRDVSPAALRREADVLDAVTLRRARHVVGEIARTVEGADALRVCDYVRFGHLMFESHASLRDDYEVSCRELDLMVDLARGRPGLYGARMVGAGFGGCTVNLVSAEAAGEFARAMASDYRARTGTSPEVYEFRAGAGAEVRAC